MAMEEPYHIPALLPEALEGLNIRPNGTYVDVTFGGGGHSRAILERLGRDGHLYGFDRDIEAVHNAPDDDRFTIIHSDFRYLTNFMAYHDVDQIDGLLADLGVSFHHFDDPTRGFSFRFDDSPLDMRMTPGASRTAAQLIAESDESRLTEIFRTYGELSNAAKLSRAIVNFLKTRPIESTSDLVEAVKGLLNPKQEKKELACVFQALRIVVNDEMQSLRRLLTSSADIIRPGGRIAIITYHSLEDRLVKNFLRTGNLDGEVKQDIFGNTNAPFKPLSNKPVVPDEAEIERNPRSRSAKLRVAIRI